MAVKWKISRAREVLIGLAYDRAAPWLKEFPGATIITETVPVRITASSSYTADKEVIVNVIKQKRLTNAEAALKYGIVVAGDEPLPERFSWPRCPVCGEPIDPKPMADSELRPTTPAKCKCGWNGRQHVRRVPYE